MLLSQLFVSLSLAISAPDNGLIEIIADYIACLAKLTQFLGKMPISAFGYTFSYILEKWVWPIS